MKTQQGQNSITLIVATILLFAVSALSWYLLKELVAIGGVISSDVVMMAQVGIALCLSIMVILMVKQLTAPAKQNANDRKLEKVIENALLEPGKIRTTIIRLRQIIEPDQINLAASLATLLEQLLSSLESTSKEQQIQQEKNLSISQTANELQQKHDKLMKTPRQRSEFLSRMGDEITLPMNSLASMMKLLNKLELKTEARDLLNIASHSAYSLIENLNNILEFSKLDVNLLELHKKHFDVTEAISSALETQESMALSKSLIIETQIKPDVPEIIYGDQKAIIKVLTNLLTNAIRFTDQGYIRVVVDNKRNETSHLLRFTVIDTGVGIPESALNSLFDSLDNDTDLVNSSFTGRLRLIVSKQLCELMGGEIGVRSQQGIGSQFWFTIDISEHKH